MLDIGSDLNCPGKCTESGEVHGKKFCDFFFHWYYHLFSLKAIVSQPTEVLKAMNVKKVKNCNYVFFF